MQTKINATLAIGIPGEFVNTNLRRVDAYLADTDVTLGAVAAIKGGKAVAVGTDGATAGGVFVSTHQHIAANGPVDGYTPTLKVAKGNEIGVATMGDVFVDVELPTTTLAVTGATSKADAISKVIAAAKAIALPQRGESIYFTSAGAITQTATSNTLLGKVVHASEDPIALDEADVLSLVTITEGESSITVAVKDGAKITVTTGVRIG